MAATLARARIAGWRTGAQRPQSSRPCVAAAAGSKAPQQAAVAIGASLLLAASPAFANATAPVSYDEQLLEIVRARGTELVVPEVKPDKQAKAVEAAKPFEALEAPALTVKTLEAVPAEQRKELIRQEAVLESQAASLALDAASSAPAGPGKTSLKSPAARTAGTSSSSAGPESSAAALSVLGVLAVAGAAAYSLNQANNPTDSSSVTTTGSSGATPAASPAVPASAVAAESAAAATPAASATQAAADDKKSPAPA